MTGPRVMHVMPLSGCLALFRPSTSLAHFDLISAALCIPLDSSGIPDVLYVYARQCVNIEPGWSVEFDPIWDDSDALPLHGDGSTRKARLLRPPLYI